MSQPRKLNSRPQRGVAYVIALVMLAIFSSLAVAFTVSTDMNLRKGQNCVSSANVRLAAESGLSFHVRILSEIEPAAGVTGADLVADIAAQLASSLDNTANLNGAVVGYSAGSTTITVPTISVGDDKTFSATISLDGSDNMKVHLAVTGSCGTMQKTVGLDYQVTQGSSDVFAYGIASRSTIRITGNARILGANSPQEASVLTTTYSTNEAVAMTGNALIAGDVSISNPSAYATLMGNISIGGETLSSGNIDDHINIGIGNVEFPEVDPSVFEPFATNIVNSGTNTNGNKTFDNIRIVAGTNPTFSGNITLNGVVFIETPNIVRFTGNLTIKGVIVTQDAGEGVYDVNRIKFTGNTNVQGVETLPDTPEFHDLRQMPGAFLLAPGFGTEFMGNFGTVSGTMAADQFTFMGNAGGTVKGTIINYSDSEFQLTGNSNITIDRSGTPATPPGFSVSNEFAPVPSSYREY